MSRFRLLLAAGAAVVSIGSTAHASIITTAAQELSFGPQKTEFGGLTEAFGYFDSSLGTLDSVTISSSFGFTSQVTVLNNAATSSRGSVAAEGTLILSAQDPNVNAVLQSLLNTSADPVSYGGYVYYTQDVLGTRKSYNLAPGASSTVASNSSTQSLGPITDANATDLLAFELAGGGSTSLVADTFTQTDLSNNGGNTNTIENTVGTAAFSIFYTYDDSTAQPPSDVPEPASMALLGVGMVAVGFTRRRNS